jgi:hypothetical protein
MKKIIVLLVLALSILACGTSATPTTDNNSIIGTAVAQTAQAIPTATSQPVPTETPQITSNEYLTIEDILMQHGFTRLYSIEDSNCDGIICRLYGEETTKIMAILKKDGELGFDVPLGNNPEASGVLLGKVFYELYPESISEWIAYNLQNSESLIENGQVQTTLDGFKITILVSPDYASIQIIIMPLVPLTDSDNLNY